MATWLTGRTRSLTFSGSITMGATGTYGCLPGGSGAGYLGLLTGGASSLTIQCMGFTITIDCQTSSNCLTFECGSPAPFKMSTFLSLAVSYLGNPLYSNSQTLDYRPYTDTNSVSGNGTWTITVPVNEQAATYTPAASAPVNGTSFPTYGGGAQGDGLPALGIQFSEVFQAGSDIAFAVTAGALSYSTSVPASGFGAPGPSYVFYADALASSVEGFTQTCATTFEFNRSPVGCSYDPTWSQGSVSCSNGVSVTTTAASGYVEATTECIASINPTIPYTLNGRLVSFTSPFPSTENLVWNCSAAGQSVALSPTGSATENQQQFQAYAKFNGVTQTGLAAADQVPVSAYLSGLASTGDDSRDWRMQFRGYQWNALSLSRASSIVIDPCTALTQWTAGPNTTLSLSGGVVATALGGPGSLTLAVPTSVRVWEVFRYLQISGQASGALSLAVTIAGQSWPLSLGSTSEPVTLDLCCAPSDTETVDSTQSRYPLQGSASSPTTTDPTNAYKLGWGVNYANTLVISGIPNGDSITLTGVELVSAAPESTQTAIAFLEGFLNFVNGWSVPTVSTTTVQPYLLIESDDRGPIDIPAMCLVTPSGGGSSPSYVYYSLSQLQAILAYFPGLTPTLLTCPVTDGYHGASQAGLTLGGIGSTYNWSTEGWTDWIDVGVTGTFPAQDIWDEVQVYPQAGQVWTQSGSYGVPTLLQTSKLLRGQAWGDVFDNTGLALSGQAISLYETANPGMGEGSATSGVLGGFLTGSPWAFGNIDSTTDLNVAPIPHLTNHGVIQNRQRFRSSFRHVPVVTRSLGYDVANNVRHVRTYANSSSGTIGMRTAGNLLPQTWSDVDTGLTGVWARPRFQDLGLVWPIGLFYGDGTNCFFAQTYDEGNTWLHTTSMGGGLVGDFDEGANGVRWFFKVQDDSGTYNVYGRMMDAERNVVRDWTITTVTGVDNAPIACRESPVADGSWRIGLFFSIGGVETIQFSQDGLNFS